MTISFWVFFGVLAVICTVIVICFAMERNNRATCLVAVICCSALTLTLIIGKWYYSSTASGQRALKDQESEFSNGVERVVKVIADDGSIVYEHHGKTDIEVHDEYIVFDENGTRRILYRSKTSTLLIEEIND